MGDALADDVVDRHERAVAAERLGHRRGDQLDAAEQAVDIGGVEVGQRDDVPARHDEHVALEHRPAVEEGDGDLVVEHDVPVAVPSITAQNGHVATTRVWRIRPDQDACMTDTATNGTPRLAPVTDPSPEVRSSSPRAGLNGPDGKPLNIFGTLAHHPALMRRWMVFATHVLSKSTLTPRDRELVILRIGARCHSQYEFSQHAIIARRSDITDEEIEATKQPIDAHPWSDKDAALVRAADELHDDAAPRPTRPGRRSPSELSTEQVMDVVFAVGQYNLVSMFLNTAGRATRRGGSCRSVNAARTPAGASTIAGPAGATT